MLLLYKTSNYIYGVNFKQYIEKEQEFKKLSLLFLRQSPVFVLCNSLRVLLDDQGSCLFIVASKFCFDVCNEIKIYVFFFLNYEYVTKQLYLYILIFHILIQHIIFSLSLFLSHHKSITSIILYFVFLSLQWQIEFWVFKNYLLSIYNLASDIIVYQEKEYSSLSPSSLAHHNLQIKIHLLKVNCWILLQLLPYLDQQKHHARILPL